jgi:hypothetical protein
VTYLATPEISHETRFSAGNEGLILPEGIGESKVRVGEVQSLVRPGGKSALLQR